MAIDDAKEFLFIIMILSNQASIKFWDCDPHELSLIGV